MQTPPLPKRKAMPMPYFDRPDFDLGKTVLLWTLVESLKLGL